MLYLQLKPRAVISPGTQLLLRHVADTADQQNTALLSLPIPCPDTPGIWKLPSMTVIRTVLPHCENVTLLGPDQCYVHVVPEKKRNGAHPLRACLAFLLLMAGSALAITWFHADVNMQEAQQALFRIVTGREAESIWLLTIPYALGVFFGVALFYALLGKKRTVSPLEIKQEEYRKSAEESAGKII